MFPGPEDIDITKLSSSSDLPEHLRNDPRAIAHILSKFATDVAADTRFKPGDRVEIHSYVPRTSGGGVGWVRSEIKLPSWATVLRRVNTTTASVAVHAMHGSPYYSTYEVLTDGMETVLIDDFMARPLSLLELLIDDPPAF